VDPLADEFVSWSSYHYVYNNPLRYTDPTGAAPDDWYEDQEGNIVYDENITSQKDLNIAGISGTYLGEQGTGIEPTSGEMVTYNCDGTTSCSPVVLPEVTVTASKNSSKQVAASISDGVGGLGAGLQYYNNKDLIIGMAMEVDLNGQLSNSKVQTLSRLYSISRYGKTIGKLGAAGTLVVGGVDIYSNYDLEGGFGTYTQRATGRFAGSLLGGYGGAAIGASIGAWFGGLGAIPGGIIGGLLGGYGGSKAGEQVVKEIQNIRP